MMRSTKHERDELVNVRGKLFNVLKFLRAKGFKEEDILDEQMIGNIGVTRDEFGLPGKVPAVGKVSDKFPHSVSGPSGAKNDLGQENAEIGSKSGPKTDGPVTNVPNSDVPILGNPSSSGGSQHKVSTPAKRPQSPSFQDNSEQSASPVYAFRNLKKVDEIDMKKGSSSTTDPGEFQLSRSQRKKLRKQGKSPIPPSH
ncbi:hypothetical protein ACET3Z_018279 [Daucus carota]